MPASGQIVSHLSLYFSCRVCCIASISFIEKSLIASSANSDLSASLYHTFAAFSSLCITAAMQMSHIAAVILLCSFSFSQRILAKCIILQRIPCTRFVQMRYKTENVCNILLLFVQKFTEWQIIACFFKWLY